MFPQPLMTTASPTVTSPTPRSRFWKEYIDFTLGNWTNAFGNSTFPGNTDMSYGPDYIWGTPQITAKPTGNAPERQ